ncbi:MAG: hypothetical protein EON57_14895 [Alphaproteobacteria bacterium]|nr:MAG: hypothetical protein EON57_14895 [Alphaproteobacteria bacterium]
MRAGRFLAVGVGLALLGAALFPAWGNAQEQLTDKNAIVACMLEKSTDRDKGVMRDFIIAALQEDAAAMKTNLDLLGNVLLDLAVSKCSMSMTLMNETDFGQVGEMYGEKLGEALIAAAFAKMN